MELVMVGKLKRCNEVDMHCTDQVMCLCVWVFKNAWCHGGAFFCGIRLIISNRTN